MTHDDGHHLVIDEIHHLLHQIGRLHHVTIEPPHQILPGMTDDLTGQWHVAQLIEGAGI